MPADYAGLEIRVRAASDSQGAIRCVAAAPDGARIAAGDLAGNVYCLRYAEGR